MKLSLVSLLVASVLAEEKLQIGILKKVPDCTEKARPGDLVSVHYSGKLKDTGVVFDNSYSRGKPIQFTLGAHQVIEGWDQGIAGMCVGEKRRLTIPPSLGYGDAGAGGQIPPKATLVFDTELVSIDSNRDEL